MTSLDKFKEKLRYWDVKENHAALCEELDEIIGECVELSSYRDLQMEHERLKAEVKRALYFRLNMYLDIVPATHTLRKNWPEIDKVIELK